MPVQPESVVAEVLVDGAPRVQSRENATDSSIRRIADCRHQIESFFGTPIPLGEELPVPDVPRFLTQADVERLMLERPPFFFIERAVAFGQHTVFGLARMTAERSAGHFPGRPIVPLIELCKAMAQTGIILVSLQARPHEAPIAIASGESKALAKELIAAPADVLVKVTLQTSRLRLHIVEGSAYIAGHKIGSLAKIVYTLLPREQLSTE